jgi:hypothetical protein
VALAPARAANDVFINIPFDPSYEYLYLSLIAGLVATGLNPRCVVEIPSGDDRLARIFKLISVCPYSIHDLSAVGLSRKPFRVPRFNMPFELGLAVALNLTSQGQHRFRILDAVKHRAEQSLSDLKGYDAYVHNKRASGVLDAILDMFSKLSGRPLDEIEDLRWVYRELATARRTKLRRTPDIFRADPFAKLVVAARELVTLRRTRVS